MTGRTPPPEQVYATVEEADQHGADWLADAILESVAQRGRCAIAVSGGRSPWPMFAILAERDDLPWDRIMLFQVDERIAPEGDEDRNLTHLKANLLSQRPELEVHTHPMPVNDEDLDAACRRYEQLLEEACGSPPSLDIVHLGLGPDGHTASLVPGDSVLQVHDRDVDLTGGEYQGRRRMTLTYPCINRAQRIMWQIVGEGKSSALRQMRAGDPSMPGSAISTDQAVIFADAAAAD
ncbi:MAG: 6-phosphogluconolactonase [Phycisphaerales bacterium]|nr:6-phosphogluconolactonase [Phycisphaerales bacterium]